MQENRNNRIRSCAGTALQKGFEHLNHTVRIMILNLIPSINNLTDTEIIYVCVGTPPR